MNNSSRWLPMQLPGIGPQEIQPQPARVDHRRQWHGPGAHLRKVAPSFAIQGDHAPYGARLRLRGWALRRLICDGLVEARELGGRNNSRYLRYRAVK